MSITTIVENVTCDAEWLFEQCCNRFSLNSSGVDPSQKLLLLTVVKDICQGIVRSSNYEQPEELALLLKRKALSEKPQEIAQYFNAKNKLVSSDGNSILMLSWSVVCYRLISTGGIEAAAPRESQLIHLISRMQIGSKLMSRPDDELARQDFSMIGGSLQINECLHLIAEDLWRFSSLPPTLVTDSFAQEVFSAVDSIVDKPGLDQRIYLIVAALANGELTPNQAETWHSWASRITVWYQKLVTDSWPQPHKTAYQQKRITQEAEFKGSQLKKLITSEAINRLNQLAKEKVFLVDKTQFEAQLGGDMRPLDDECMSDDEYARLVTVASSLAYLAIKLLRRNGGWFVDENGDTIIDLRKAGRLRVSC